MSAARRCRQCWQKIIQCTMPAGGCIGRGWVHADTRKHSCLPWAPLCEDGTVLVAAHPMPDVRFDLVLSSPGPSCATKP